MATAAAHHYPAGCDANVVSGPAGPEDIRWGDLDDAEVDSVRDEFLRDHGPDFLCTLDDVEGDVAKTTAELLSLVKRWRRWKAEYLARKNRA